MTAQDSSGSGLAVTSLVLGAVGLVLSLCVVGLIPAAIGLVLGLVHLRRSQEARTMARWGVGLSAAAVVLSLLMAIAAFTSIRFSESSDAKVARWVGVRSPDLVVTTLDGEEIQLAELQGRRVVLNFWATWCGPCVSEIPHFMRFVSEADPGQVVVVGLSYETEDELWPFVSDKGMNYAVVSVDGLDLPEPYRRVPAFPTTFVLDRNGVIQHTRVGYLDHDALVQLALDEDWTGPVLDEPADVGD